MLAFAKSTSASSYYDYTSDPWLKQRFSASSKTEKSTLPEEGKRILGMEERFPPVHLDMAREKSSKLGSKTLPVTIYAHGNVASDAILKQNENAKRIVYSQHKDLVPKFLKNDDEEEDRMDDDEERQREIEETTRETKLPLRR